MSKNIMLISDMRYGQYIYIYTLYIHNIESDWKLNLNKTIFTCSFLYLVVLWVKRLNFHTLGLWTGNYDFNCCRIGLW